MRDYRVLGTCEVWQDGVLVDLGPPKQRAVLAALLLGRGAVVSTDRLIDAVWGAAPPAAALTGLQAYISNLRRALRGTSTDPSPIERVSPGYRLVLGADRLDIVEFGRSAQLARESAGAGRWVEALSESEVALAMWRGPLLAEFGDDDWVSVTAAGLVELRNAARDDHVTALLAQGDMARALEEITVARADDPLRDRGVWLHMVALYRAGRATEALDVYTAHARTLDTELGLVPGHELAELQSAILNHDPVVAGWPRRPHWSGGVPVAAPNDQAASSHISPTARGIRNTFAQRPFVGRYAEHAAIEGLYRADRSAVTRWVAICGPAGIGKTRLAEEAARIAADAGERVIWVRCPDAGGLPAWWPLRQLCRALGADADQLLSVPAGADADTARFEVYDRIQRLLESSSTTTGLTIIVDDVQWADVMSLGLLRYLTGVLRQSAVCVVVTIRDEEAGPEVIRLRTALARAGGVLIDVSGLDPSDVAELVREIAEEDLTEAEVRTLAARTGGNPLFVSEYARLPRDQRLGEAVPTVVRSVLDRRLASLEPMVLEVVAHAAVIGDDIDVVLLAEVMERAVDDVAECLDEAADERILSTSPVHGGAVFAHALLREEARSTIRPLRRCRIHARVAEVVARRGMTDAPARRAAHLLAALPVVEVREVVDACRTAADHATAQWDSENSAYWLASALRTYEALPAVEQDIGERDGLLIDLLEARSRAGQAQSVLETVEERLVEAVANSSTSTVGRLASALLRSGGGWPWMAPWTDPGGLHRVLTAAAQAVSGDPASHARVLGALAIGHCYDHDPAVPAGYLADADALAARLGDVDVTADVTLARLITYSGVAEHVPESLVVARRLLAMPHGQAAVDTVIADSVLTMSTLACGDIAATERHLQRGIAGSERLKLPILRAQLRWMEVTLAVWRGRFELAKAHFRTAVAVHEQTELYVAGSDAIATMAMATEEGLLEAVVDSGQVGPIQWARQVVTAATDSQVTMLLASGVAMIAGRAGDRALARTMIERWLADDGAMVWTSLAQAVLLGHVVADLAMVEYTERFIDYLMPFRSRIATVGQVGSIGPVALAIAELQVLQGREDDARQLVAQAAELCTATGGVPSLLRCRLLAVRVGAVTGDREQELLDIAVRAEEIGVSRVAQAARDLLGQLH